MNKYYKEVSKYTWQRDTVHTVMVVKFILGWGEIWWEGKRSSREVPCLVLYFSVFHWPLFGLFILSVPVSSVFPSEFLCFFCKSINSFCYSTTPSLFICICIQWLLIPDTRSQQRGKGSNTQWRNKTQVGQSNTGETHEVRESTGRKDVELQHKTGHEQETNRDNWRPKRSEDSQESKKSKIYNWPT